MLPDGKHEPNAHVESPGETNDTEKRNAADMRRDFRKDDDAGANQHGRCQDGIGQAIGDGIKRLAQRLETLGVDLVLKGDAELPVFDLLIEIPEVMGKLVEEIEAIANQFAAQ